MPDARDGWPVCPRTPPGAWTPQRSHASTLYDWSASTYLARATLAVGVRQLAYGGAQLGGPATSTTGIVGGGLCRQGTGGVATVLAV